MAGQTGNPVHQLLKMTAAAALVVEGHIPNYKIAMLYKIKVTTPLENSESTLNMR